MILMSRRNNIKPLAPSKQPKYRNKKVVIDGITFDSHKEAEYYNYLKLLEERGKIKDLKCHPRFAVVQSARWNGKTLRMRYYEADFQFEKDGMTIVVDVKSEITRKNPVYTLKRQLFLLEYPEYEFEEWN